VLENLNYSFYLNNVALPPLFLSTVESLSLNIDDLAALKPFAIIFAMVSKSNAQPTLDNNYKEICSIFDISKLLICPMNANINIYTLD